MDKLVRKIEIPLARVLAEMEQTGFKLDINGISAMRDSLNQRTEDLEKEIQAKIEERNQAKKDKDYAKADQIRNELLEKGIKLIDSREGTTYELV